MANFKVHQEKAQRNVRMLRLPFSGYFSILFMYHRVICKMNWANATSCKVYTYVLRALHKVP